MSGKRLNKRQLRQQQELEELEELAEVDHLKPSKPSGGQSKFAQLDQNQSEDDNVDGDDSEDEQDEGGNHKSTSGLSGTRPTTASVFAALGNQEVEEAHDEGEDEGDADIPAKEPAKGKSNKKKKKKKKAAAQSGDPENGDAKTPTLQEPSKSSTSSSTQKKASSAITSAASTPATAKGKTKGVSEMSDDEFEAILASQAELNARESASTLTGRGTPSHSSLRPTSISAFRTHLSLDPKNLDPGIELRRQFGSAAIKAYQNEAGSGGRASSGARARAQATNPNMKVRSILCQPKEHFPPIARTFTGLNMDVVDSSTHGRICTWKHSKAYKQVQMQFLQAVKSFDISGLFALYRVYPYHIDTLLQLSEDQRGRGDLGQAAEFIDMALFAFERCASPYFTSCLTSTTTGPPLVNFNKIENRAFYLAIHRKIGYLGRRGTWRTALEYAKLLLGLGPDGQDHHAALLWVDFLAIKSKQHRWLLELINKLDYEKTKIAKSKVQDVDDLIVPAVTPIDSEKQLAGEDSSYAGTLDWCAGLLYAKALALRTVEKEEQDKTGQRSRVALRLAIARHPAVVPLLCNKIGIDLPSKIAGHPVFQPESRWAEGQDTTSSLLAQIYVLRSESLWKESGLGQWLRSTAMELADTLIQDHELGKKSTRKPAIASHTTKRGIWRHILVSDVPDTVRQQLIAYLPPSITSNSEQMDAFDPVPPINQVPGAVADDDVDSQIEKVTRYDDEYFEPIMDQISRQQNARGSRGGIGQEEGGLMQAFMRAIQGVGGLQGWDAAMQNMDDETREDVMAQIMQMTAEARRARGGEEDEMPGGFGAAPADTEVEDAAPRGMGAFAALRGALDAIWGGARGANPAANQEEEEHETDEEETEAVEGDT